MEERASSPPLLIPCLTLLLKLVCQHSMIALQLAKGSEEILDLAVKIPFVGGTWTG
jgi:hypothetical protein